MKLKAILFVLLALSWGMLAWLWVRSSRQDAVVRSLNEQLRAARTKVLPPPAPKVVMPPADIPKRIEEHEAPRAAPEPAVDPQIEALTAKLQESAASQAKLQARVGELETEVLNIMGERARSAASEKEALAKVAELTKTVDAMNEERPATEKRLHDLEAEAGRLREQNAAAVQKSAQFDQFTAELRDISRRQQACVTNIQRRYREVTNVFRTMPGMMEERANGAEVTRIQTTMSMADEDVRQLNDLNARLGRLEKRISAPDRR